MVVDDRSMCDNIRSWEDLCAILNEKGLSFKKLLIGFGFVYNAIYGSNNEVQIAKVYWHETRYIHGVLYLLSALYLYRGNIRLTCMLIELVAPVGLVVMVGCVVLLVLRCALCLLS